MARLSMRARAQRDHLELVSNKVAVRAIALLIGRGVHVDQIASNLSLMVKAAMDAVVKDAATNAELDGKTGEFTELSLDSAIPVDEYATHLADIVQKEVE